MISIAMATYNGEKHLREQLASIASQTYLPLELVVCDDGSTDQTLSILDEFSALAPFNCRILSNRKRLGFADNFLKSASCCKGEWIAFCDQDDVWLPTKLENAYREIVNNSKLRLVLQNAYICDDGLNKTERVFPDSIRPKTYVKRSQAGFWVWPGFLQTFRADLLNEQALARRPKSYYPGHKIITHDKLVCLLANAMGDIAVSPEPVALYRRHAAAVTGDYSPQSLRQRVEKSLPVGGDHYVFLAEVADGTAKYLRRIAESSDLQKSAQLKKSADCFDKISSINACRAQLYLSTTTTERIKWFVRVMQFGGYWGPPMISLGWKSGVKDLLRMLGLLGRAAPDRSL